MINKVSLCFSLNKKGNLMGGFGSGNRNMRNSKDTVESRPCVDVRYLKRHNLLRPGASGQMSWSRGGEQTGAIGFRVEPERLVLEYNHRPFGGEWKPVEQSVRFDRTPCTFGGSRTWLKCPPCNRRVAVIYDAGKHFLCRHCCDLNYASQQETTNGRAIGRAKDIHDDWV